MRDEIPGYGTPQKQKSQQEFASFSLNKSGWQDSNLRTSRTHAGRDTSLRYPPETKKPTRIR